MMVEIPTATAFPGMGPTKFSDVAKFMLINPYARELVATADEVLGYDLFAALRDASSDYAEAAQVGFLVNSVALARWAENEYDYTPSYVTGASFGGKAAAIHSGALSAEDGIWLTQQLVQVEEEYFAEQHGDIVTLSFTRTPSHELGRILVQLDDWHEISCHVDEDFAMVSLRRDRVEWLRKEIRAAGGFPLYEMDPPMHVSIFGELRDRIERELIGKVTFTTPTTPVIADQDGTVRTTADGVRDILLDGVVQPVRWPAVVKSLRDKGIERLCVAGPDALWGRVRCTANNFEVISATPRLAMQPRKRSVLTGSAA